MTRKRRPQKQIIKPNFFDELPNEMLAVILSYLGPDDLCQVAMTCSRWRAVSEDDHLWAR